MKLEHYKLAFIALGLVGVLIFASPTLSMLIQTPSAERFSELYILGPERMASNIPFNIKSGVNYQVYLGIGNHMGSPAYYICNVKLRNQTEPLPNTTAGIPSSVAPLYSYRAFVENGKVWEIPLTFMFSNISISNDEALLESVFINGAKFDVGKRAQWDSENRGYYYQFFVELWVFDSVSETIRFNDRYVYFWLNATLTQ